MEREQETAYHEAGHVVAHHVLGLPFEYVTIVPDEDSEGHIIDADYEPGELGASMEENDYQYSEMVILCASVGAEKHLTSETSTLEEIEGAIAQEDPDHDALRCYARSIAGTGDLDRQERLQVCALEDARRLVTHYWADVETIANALLRRKTLSSEEVRALLTTPQGIEQDVRGRWAEC